MVDDESSSSSNDRDDLKNVRVYGTLMVIAGMILMTIALIPGGLAAESIQFLLRLLSWPFNLGGFGE